MENAPQKTKNVKPIVLDVSDAPERKGRYVAAARRANKPLAKWMFDVCDDAAKASEDAAGVTFGSSQSREWWVVSTPPGKDG